MRGTPIVQEGGASEHPNAEQFRQIESRWFHLGEGREDGPTYILYTPMEAYVTCGYHGFIKPCTMLQDHDTSRLRPVRYPGTELVVRNYHVLSRAKSTTTHALRVVLVFLD